MLGNFENCTIKFRGIKSMKVYLDVLMELSATLVSTRLVTMDRFGISVYGGVVLKNSPFFLYALL